MDKNIQRGNSQSKKSKNQIKTCTRVSISVAFKEIQIKTTKRHHSHPSNWPKGKKNLTILSFSRNAYACSWEGIGEQFDSTTKIEDLQSLQ